MVAVYLAVLLVAPAGCQTTDESPEQTSASGSIANGVAQVPHGYKLYEDPAGHFSIAYPDSWVVRVDFIAQFSSPEGGLTISVGTDPFQFLPPPSPKAQLRDRLEVLDQFPGSKVISQGPTTLSGWPAYGAHFIDTSTGETVEEYQVFTNGDGTERNYVLSYGGPADSVRNNLPLLRESASTLAIVTA